MARSWLEAPREYIPAWPGSAWEVSDTLLHASEVRCKYGLSPDATDTAHEPHQCPMTRRGHGRKRPRQGRHKNVTMADVWSIPLWLGVGQAANEDTHRVPSRKKAQTHGHGNMTQRTRHAKRGTQSFIPVLGSRKLGRLAFPVNSGGGRPTKLRH